MCAKMRAMDAAQKLEADIRRAKKAARERGKDALPFIERSFLALNGDAPSLAHAFYDFWYETYAAPRNAPAEGAAAGVSDGNVRKLCAIQALLELDFDGTDDLTESDLRALCEAADYAADDAPLEKLSALMAFFLERGAM